MMASLYQSSSPSNAVSSRSSESVDGISSVSMDDIRFTIHLTAGSTRRDQFEILGPTPTGDKAQGAAPAFKPCAAELVILCTVAPLTRRRWPASVAGRIRWGTV